MSRQKTSVTRRFTQNRTITLANKIGNAIPINQIADDTAKTVCSVSLPNIQSQPKITNIIPINPQMDAQESSTDIECIGIKSTHETPEKLRIYIKTETPKPLKENTPICDKESPILSKALSHVKATRTTPPHSPRQKAISSRYNIDRTATTLSSPDANLIKNFNAAMNILKAILPTKTP